MDKGKFHGTRPEPTRTKAGITLTIMLLLLVGFQCEALHPKMPEACLEVAK